MATSLSTTSFLAVPENTGGFRVLVDSGTTVDNIFIVQDGSLKFRIHPYAKGVYHLSWVVDTTGDKTSVIQAIVNHADITTIVVDKVYTISGSLTIPSSKTVRFDKGGQFTGSGNFIGGIVQAPYSEEIFGASLSINFSKTQDDFFSAKWASKTNVWFASTTEANTEIPSSIRYTNLTVLIDIGGVPVYHWWLGGTADGNLVPKFTLDNALTSGRTTTQGLIFSGSSTNRNTELKNYDLTDNVGGLRIYPSSGTNVGSTFSLIPKGTGLSSTFKSQFLIYNTDAIADAVNHESGVFRALGADGYGLISQKAGTGTVRQIFIDASGTGTVATANMVFKTDGTVRLPGGSPAAGKIFVSSDTSGNASWVVRDNLRTITTNDSVLITDKTILINATSGNVTLTYNPATIPQIINVKRIDATANTVTISPSSGTIDGSANIDLLDQYTSVSIHSNGTNLFIL